MILQSRKWRLLIRGVMLVLTSLLMLASAVPASYALQDDTPQLITRAEQLFDKKQPVTDSYVYISTAPDLGHIVAMGSSEDPYYWTLVPHYGNQLLIRFGADHLHSYVRSLDRHGAAGGSFYGKITTLKSQVDSQDVLDGLAERGVEVDKETAMVILQGEEPSAYRPMVPVVGVLVVLWVLTLAGLLRILRGRHPKRRQTSFAMRELKRET